MRTHNKPDFAARLFKVLRRTNQTQKLEMEFAGGCISALREVADFESVDNFEVNAESYDAIVAHLESYSEMVSGHYHKAYKHVADLVRRYASALRDEVSE